MWENVEYNLEVDAGTIVKKVATIVKLKLMKEGGTTSRAVDWSRWT